MREESQKIAKRVLSIMLTVIMMLSVFMPVAPVLAAEKPETTASQQSEEAAAAEPQDEYAKAKAEYAKEKAEKYDFDPSARTFSLRSLFDSRSSSSGYIENEYIEAYISSNGCYTMGTVEGDPESDTDNNKLLLYGHPGSQTTETMIYIDGVGRYFDDYVNNVKFSADGKKCTATAMIDGVEVKQILTIITNPFTGIEDLISIRYEYTNTGESTSNSTDDWGPKFPDDCFDSPNSDDGSRQVGVRIMLDTMLGDNDGAPFRINGEEVTYEREYVGNDIPQYWQSFDSLEEPRVTSTGFFYFSENEKPDKVQFAHWGSIRRSSWRYYVSEYTSVTGDSAVAAYFNPRTVPAGSTGSVVTYYGISGFAGGNSNLDGELGVRVTSPAKMTVSEDGGYANNPFSVSVYINNRGERTLENLKAVLSINDAQQLVLDDSQASTVSVGDLEGGCGSSLLWKLRALPQQAKVNAEFKISFYEGSELIKEMPLSVELASLNEDDICKTVTFDLNGADGEAPKAQEVIIGTVAEKPADPEREGYSFGGWYSNKNCTGPAWFNTFNNFKGEVVTQNITLYAKWIDSVNSQNIVYGTDTYSFINSDYDFHNGNYGNYVITGDYYDTLLSGLTRAEKSRVIDMMYSYWGGSCFGMSSVLSLVKAGKLDTEFFQGDADKLYDFKRPAESSVITNLIDFYQIIQVTDYTAAARSDYDRQSETANNKKVIDALKESNYPVVMGFNIYSNGYPIGGHAVVAYGYEETENGYTVSIWDPNDNETPNKLNISKDYTTSEFETFYDSEPYSTYIKYALTVEDGTYDYKNIQQALISMGKTGGAEQLALMSLGNARAVVLETSYDSFRITDSKGNEAVIENGKKISGDLDITDAEYLNEKGEQVRTQYVITGTDDDEYTIQDNVADTSYKTSLIYDDDTAGFYTSVSSESSGSVTFLSDGTVSTEYENTTQQKVVVSTNDSQAPWYSQSVEGETSGLTVAPAADGAAISSADDTSLNISARDDYNSVVFDNFTFEADTQLKLTQSTENDNTALLGDESQTMGYSLTFVTSGGSAIEAQTDIPSGQTAERPEDPERGGFIFAGWYTSEECKDGEEWSFDTPITENTRIYAKWLVDNSYVHKVTFKAEGHDDQIFSVRDGGSLDEIPEVPEKACGEGKWDISNFNNITSDIIVNAVYRFTHNYPDEVAEHIDPKCTEDGYDKYICTLCGYENIKPIDSIGHDMGEYNLTVEPTCTTDGARVSECSRCDYEKSKVVPARHTDTTPDDGICDICQENASELVNGQTYTVTEDNNMFYVDVNENDCIYLVTDKYSYVTVYNTDYELYDERFVSAEKERQIYNYELNEFYLLVEPDEEEREDYPIEFTFRTCAHNDRTDYPYVAPTCTECGREEGTKCNDCGRWLEGGYELEPEHTFTNDWSVPSQDGVTCTREGIIRIECDKCDEYLTRWVPARHMDKNVDGKCDICSKTASDFVSGQKKEVTVDWDTNCRYLFVAPKTGEYTIETFDINRNWPYVYLYDEMHYDMDCISYDRDDNNNLKKAFYLKKGCTYYVEVDADDECTYPVSITYNQCKHPTENKKSYPQQNATCTKAGITAGIYCSYCESWISGHKTVPATGHKGGKATCKTQAICTSCKKPYGSVNANNHKSLVTLNAKAATYKSTGLTAGKKCTACNKITLKQYVTPMLKLAQVTGIKATPSTKSIKLTWNKVTGAEKYEVKYVGGGKTVTKTVTANTINLTALKTVTNYKVTIKAVAGTNKGAEGSLTTSTAPSKVKIKSGKSSKKKTAVLSWSKVKGATRYEIQYATSKSFKSAKKTTLKSVKKTIKKLRSGRKYYFRIRAYRVVNGKNVYGSWSKTKTIRIK